MPAPIYKLWFDFSLFFLMSGFQKIKGVFPQISLGGHNIKYFFSIVFLSISSLVIKYYIRIWKID